MIRAIIVTPEKVNPHNKILRMNFDMGSNLEILI